MEKNTGKDIKIKAANFVT
jgi:calcium-dependent protein kinase